MQNKWELFSEPEKMRTLYGEMVADGIKQGPTIKVGKRILCELTHCPVKSGMSAGDFIIIIK